MTEAATILRTGRKFDQVLRGAREVFLRDGFEGASVDDIARTAGVSKATLYTYFPDKRALFVEVVTAECDRMSGRILAAIAEEAPLREVLRLTAGHLVRFLTSEFSQRVFRICVAEADRFPELGQAFYDKGPRMGRDRMVAYLEQAAARGELCAPDLALAAEQFSELCKVRLWTRAVFGIQHRFTDAEIDAVADAAVETFMAAYGAPEASATGGP